MRRLVPGIVLAVLLAGCGSTSEKASTSGPAHLQLRHVTSVAENRNGCPTGVEPDPAKSATLCDADGNEYRLEPAVWDGTVASATAGIPANEVSWAVTISLPSPGAAALEKLSAAGGRLAVVVAGTVLTAPTIASRITTGQIQIGGALSEADAKALAKRLTKGANR